VPLSSYSIPTDAHTARPICNSFRFSILGAQTIFTGSVFPKYFYVIAGCTVKYNILSYYYYVYFLTSNKNCYSSTFKE